jgi:thiamine-phosphate pyrophosphorylase
MADRCLLYYITDRRQFPGDEHSCRRALLDKIAEATRAGVDYIQLREKDLSARELEKLAVEVVRVIREEERRADRKRRGATRFLINSRTDIALAAGANGVHLRSNDISARDVREIAGLAGRRPPTPEHFVIAVSCHSKSDVDAAESEGADFAVFAPVFGKNGAPDIQPKSWAELREACGANIPVFALGGVTLANAAPCLAAGAAGIAGIRLFQEHNIEEVVDGLRRM